MRDTIERQQAWIYLTAILVGMTMGYTLPKTAASWEILIWPLMAGLLYATFTQVPFANMAIALRDKRFLAALLVGNFIVMPVISGVLLLLLPDNAAIKLGVLLVLLVPCTDWFISFAHLGRGDAARAVSAAPILLITQLLLMPFYIWLFLGELVIELTFGSHLLSAFAGLILLPMALAWLTEKAAGKRQKVADFVKGLGWFPVPLLAMVVFIIAASQVSLVLESGQILWQVVVVFVLYLLAAGAAGKLINRAFVLEPRAGRTLTFSLGTRNSFVVLPLALSLPDAWSLVAVVIVLQSLVELFGMVAYVRWVPTWLIREPITA
ncbi:arsenic resistance protein [Marinobacter bryozoorum]|jgi:ACR3 family arsenite efflux pump ArsB|uniref:arsenic resistance protein n=1 Tax=Marinobacter bryozoorum TaxID=256324 RepID=UPI0020058E64|nr:arsenic resistance protein [Marinobacter bryozoorum]MCK7546185.1 arsenic resistance protein [Marinobacter bryozoorum]